MQKIFLLPTQFQGIPLNRDIFWLSFSQYNVLRCVPAGAAQQISMLQPSSLLFDSSYENSKCQQSTDDILLKQGGITLIIELLLYFLTLD